MTDENELMKSKFLSGIKMTKDQEGSMQKSLWLMQCGDKVDKEKKCMICGKKLYSLQCPHEPRTQELLDGL